MKTLSLKARLAWSFASLLLLTAVMAALGMHQAKRLFDNGDFYDWNIIPAYEAMHSVLGAVSDIERYDTGLAAEMRSAEPNLPATLEAQIKKGFGDYAKLIADDEDRANFERVKAASQVYLAAASSERAAPGKDTAAGAMQSFQGLQTAAATWWGYNQKLSRDYAGDSRSAFHAAITLLSGGVLLALLSGSAIAALLSRSLTRQLGGEPAYAVEAVREISTGGLVNPIQLRESDNSSLLATLENMRLSLAVLVKDVRSGSESIATASTQVTCGSADLNQRTEQQASNVQQTAATMEQLTTNVAGSAATCAQAAALSDDASKAVVEGVTVISRVEQTMERISQSSKRIGDIIGTVDGIAFQTNILALNAAVEAARAGEQGRGFAVVASEVRTLAQRSAEAAREIKALVGTSVSSVEAGTTLVAEASRTMDEITGRVHRVGAMLSEMSTATIEQSQGLKQVSAAVKELDRFTQQNAALVEENNAAAASVSDQAAKLMVAIGTFRV